MCGPSGAQTGIANQQATFGQNLTNDFGSRFADQSETLSSLSGILNNVSEGKFAPGFSAQTMAALNTGAINTTGANYANAARAVGGQLAGRGGDSGLESGVDKQIKASIASNAAGQLSTQQQQINLANAQQGIANTNTEIGGYGALAGFQNPGQFGSLASGELQNAFGSATKIQDMKNQEQADIAGGIVSLATDVALPGISGAMGGGGLSGALSGITGV